MLKQESKTEINQKLMNTLGCNDVKTAMNLIKQGANINARDKDGKDVLMHMVRIYDIELQKIMNQADAKVVYIVDDYNKASLLRAAFCGIKYSLKRGADVFAKDIKGLKAIDQTKNEQIKSLILKKQKVAGR